MPAPVSFLLSLAPLTATFSSTPQEFATAIVDRLTVTPAEPWSSFNNGGSKPGSDQGPWLKNGNEWQVWDSGIGDYTYHTQNGSGLVDATVPLTKLADGTAHGTLTYTAGGRPQALAAGADKTVLMIASGAPTYSNPVTATYFEVTVANTNQSLDTDGTIYTARFDSVKKSAGVTFDTANHRVPVRAGEVWFFYASVQIEDAATTSTEVQVTLEIRPNGANGVSGINHNSPTLNSRFGFSTSGILQFDADGYVDVGLTCTDLQSEAGGLELAANSANTRFGGFRIY